MILPFPFDTLAAHLAVGLVTGLVLGSFATMLSYRLPRHESIVMPPSHCPRCNARLTPSDLVPLFSWLCAKGRCRHCHAPISARYPLIESATALLTATAFALCPDLPTLLASLALIVASVTLVTARIERK